MFITAAGFLTDHLVHKKIKKISTHLLTALIISAIVQLEQRKGKQKDKVPDSEFQIMTNKYEVD